jgi:hypothetical protein
MIETGSDAMGIYKYLRECPREEANLSLVFFASQTVDDRVVVYHLDSVTNEILIRYCTLPQRDFTLPSDFVAGHATPVKNGLYYTFPLLPNHSWTLDQTRKKLIDSSGGVLIGMHTIVSGLSVAITCWAMHYRPKTNTYEYVSTVIPIKNPLLTYVGNMG